MTKKGIEKEKFLPLKATKPHSNEEPLSPEDFSREKLIRKTTRLNTNRRKKQTNP